MVAFVSTLFVHTSSLKEKLEPLPLFLCKGWLIHTRTLTAQLGEILLSLLFRFQKYVCLQVQYNEKEAQEKQGLHYLLPELIFISQFKHILILFHVQKNQTFVYLAPAKVHWQTHKVNKVSVYFLSMCHN